MSDTVKVRILQAFGDYKPGDVIEVPVNRVHRYTYDNRAEQITGDIPKKSCGCAEKQAQAELNAAAPNKVTMVKLHSVNPEGK